MMENKLSVERKGVGNLCLSDSSARAGLRGCPCPWVIEVQRARLHEEARR